MFAQHRTWHTNSTRNEGARSTAPPSSPIEGCSAAGKAGQALAMGNLAEENGGGVMIVFSADPEKQASVLDAIDYISKALTAHQLVVTQHRAEPKTMDHRCCFRFLHLCHVLRRVVIILVALQRKRGGTTFPVMSFRVPAGTDALLSRRPTWSYAHTVPAFCMLCRWTMNKAAQSAPGGCILNTHLHSMQLRCLRWQCGVVQKLIFASKGGNHGWVCSCAHCCKAVPS